MFSCFRGRSTILAGESFEDRPQLRRRRAKLLDHLHVHVVPRWNGDTNFMTVVGNVRVLPEELGATAAKLRPIFERLSREDC